MSRLYAGLTYEQVVSEYTPTVASVCVMRLQNWADAEDVYQNVFSKLWQKSPSFRDQEHLKAWLIRVAINECNNYIRKNRRTVSLESVTEQSVVFNEDKSDMSWALMCTPEKYRDVLYLFYIQQHPVAEIAHILKINENTVKTRLRRGREKLKQIYGGDERG